MSFIVCKMNEGAGGQAVSKVVTPMDAALAGMAFWRRQMQSAAVMGMRMSGLGASWAMPPSEAMELLARNQAEITEASRKMSALMLGRALPGAREPAADEGRDPPQPR